jgi:predicted nucleotide-binding protein (sugar kinase/HSP70/actin superfamily)
MPVPSASFKKTIKQLSDKDKETLLLKAVRRDAELYDMFAYELNEVTLEELQERSQDIIHELLLNATGRNLTKALTKALRKALKEIARFKRITKDKKAEVELHLYILDLIFRNYTGQFDSYYKVFYTSTAKLLLKTIQLIRKNLHEDYHLEYKSDIDDYLEQISNRNKPLPVTLPKEFDIE